MGAAVTVPPIICGVVRAAAVRIVHPRGGSIDGALSGRPAANAVAIFSFRTEALARQICGLSGCFPPPKDVADLHLRHQAKEIRCIDRVVLDEYVKTDPTAFFKRIAAQPPAEGWVVKSVTVIEHT